MSDRSFSMPKHAARQRAMVAAAAAILLVAAAIPSPAVAEDEDSSTQVYLVFDPETGEFIKSHDPNAALAPQTGLESSASAGPDAADGSSAGKNRTIIAVIAAALVITGVAGVAILRARRKPA